MLLCKVQDYYSHSGAYFDPYLVRTQPAQDKGLAHLLGRFVEAKSLFLFGALRPHIGNVYCAGGLALDDFSGILIKLNFS